MNVSVSERALAAASQPHCSTALAPLPHPLSHSTPCPISVLHALSQYSIPYLSTPYALAVLTCLLHKLAHLRQLPSGIAAYGRSAPDTA
eukprot:2765307-Rhodomonas_salina.1